MEPSRYYISWTQYEGYASFSNSGLVDLRVMESGSFSAICDEHGIHPTLFYQWQRTFFENGAAAFERSARSRKPDPGERRIGQLEARLKRKDEVIAAVTEELVRTINELGED